MLGRRPLVSLLCPVLCLVMAIHIDGIRGLPMRGRPRFHHDPSHSTSPANPALSDDVSRLLPPCLQIQNSRQLPGGSRGSIARKRSNPDLYALLYSMLTNKGRQGNDYNEHLKRILELPKSGLGLDTSERDTKMMRQDPELIKPDPDSMRHDPQSPRVDPEFPRQDPDVGRQDPEELNPRHGSYLNLLSRWIAGNWGKQEGTIQDSTRISDDDDDDEDEDGDNGWNSKAMSNASPQPSQANDANKPIQDLQWQGMNNPDETLGWEGEDTGLEGPELKNQKRANWEGFCPLHCGLYDDKHDYHTCMVTCSRSQ